MLTLNSKNIPVKIILSLIVGVCFLSSAFAQEQGKAFGKAGVVELKATQRQARMYRDQGYKLQSAGNMEEAMGYYQKATELDPFYAVSFNDLGVAYEAKGMIPQAENCYLTAIKRDPYFLSSYSNLALLYEGKRDFRKAVAYWQKRVNLGSPNDPWTQKAKLRLKDITLVLEGQGLAQEDEVIDLMRQISEKKALLRESNKELAQDYLKRARVSYNKDDLATALKLGASAQQMDPSDSDITEFVEKVQLRALSR